MRADSFKMRGKRGGKLWLFKIQRQGMMQRVERQYLGGAEGREGRKAEEAKAA